MLKIAKSLLLVFAVAAVATISTRAYFSDTKTIADNQFTTGTVNLTLDGLVNKPIQALNMAPGQHYIGHLFVINNGTIPADFFMKTEKTGEGSQELYDELWIKLYFNGGEGYEGYVAYDGKLKDLNSAGINGVWLTEHFNLSPRNPGESVSLYQKISLPADAGNEFQNLSVSFDEIFTALQYNPVED